MLRSVSSQKSGYFFYVLVEAWDYASAELKSLVVFVQIPFIIKCTYQYSYYKNRTDAPSPPADLNGLVRLARKTKISFMRVCHHISTDLYYMTYRFYVFSRGSCVTKNTAFFFKKKKSQIQLLNSIIKSRRNYFDTVRSWRLQSSR